jgi:dihydrofolate synthase / folylpolyglutamate synthase
MESVVNSGVKWLQSLSQFGIKPGLSRMSQVLESFGNPEHALTFFHVAGTNGKGSVCAMLASLLSCGVSQTGLFVSPAFDGYRGRFSINGERISDSDFARIATLVMKRSQSVLQDESQGESITEFEALTLMAILYFYEHKVDVVVWETGLGGRLDSTNVVMPVVTGITNVSYDHVQILGPTIRDIAGEKAGIIKSNVPVVTAAEGVAYRVIESVASEHGSTLLRSGRQFQVTREQYSEKRQLVNYRGVFGDIGGLSLPLFGAHQCVNLGIALAMYEMGSYFGVCKALSGREVRACIAAVKWPGRFEVFNQNGKTIVLDGAHNPDGATQFAGALRDYAKILGLLQDGWTMVIGIMRDKAITQMLSHVIPLASNIIFTSPDMARAASPEELFHLADELNPSATMEQIPDVTAALARALELNQPIACWGSLYTVNAARKAIKTLPTD